MSDPPPDPPHQPDHPMPPAPRSVSPDSPVDPPLPPHDKPGGGDAALKRQKQSISSSSGLNRLGGDVSLPSQSQSSQPILPTVVVPSPPAILTNPEAEDQDEDFELPTLAQEETIGGPSKKPDDNDESPDQEDGESEDSQRTRSYEDHQADLVLDEAHWSLMTAEQKICANRILYGSERYRRQPCLSWTCERDLHPIAPMRILSSEIHRSESC